MTMMNALLMQITESIRS